MFNLVLGSSVVAGKVTQVTAAEFLQKFRILDSKSVEMLTHVGCRDE
jgi:hypothetical protein